MLGNSALGQLALAEFPQKPTVSGASGYQDTIALLDTTDASVTPQHIIEALVLVDTTDASVIPNPLTVADTHDGVRKKKKKKPVSFDDELERTARLRKQITEVIHLPVLVPVEESEAKPVPEVVETKPFEIKTKVTPAVDYAGLAQQEIVDKLRLDAETKQREFLHQLELKRLADIEDEDELEMILEALL